MLQLHKDVLEAYRIAVSVFGSETEKKCNDCRFSCVQFNGTIVEGYGCDRGEGRVVARWAVDLTGRIHVKAVGSSMKCRRLGS